MRWMSGNAPGTSSRSAAAAVELQGVGEPGVPFGDDAFDEFLDDAALECE